MGFVRKDSYETDRKRPNIATVYLENMKTFLNTLYPDVDPHVVDEFIKNKIRENYKVPDTDIIYHKSEGNAEIISVPAVHYIKNIVKDRNISPSGTVYYRPSEKESFVRISLETKIKERNAFKKIYLTKKAEGDEQEADYYHKQQGNAKIFNNGIAGGMKIRQFILGDKAGFCAITSVGRLCVKQGYSFVERAVSGSIYLPSTEAAITYIINHANVVHDDFEKEFLKSGFYKPAADDLIEFIVDNVKKYVSNPDVLTISKLIHGLSSTQIAYIFYVGCFKNLFYYNESIMKAWIDSCFIEGPIDHSLFKDIDVKDLSKYDGDTIICMTSTNAYRLGKNPEKPGEYYNVYDARDRNPEGLKEFLYCCQNFVENFNKMKSFLVTILQLNTTFSKLVSQDNMARSSVSISDTDSNIFSTQELVKWKTGSYNFEQRSYEMHALLIFMITQSLEHIFARLSVGFGMDEKDIFRISMKNEFLFPVLIMTSMAKHYVAIATIQEGIILKTPLKEIKGVGLRSSTYPKLIKDRFNEFTSSFIDTVMKHSKLRAGSLFEYIANLEREIYQSIISKESIYLQTTSVKLEEDYKDAERSSHFYYGLWNEVFAEDFGEMVLPNKCFKIPLKNGDKFFKNQALIEALSEKYPDVMKRFLAFKERSGNRNIGFILIPPFKGEIKSFFVDAMDIRSHISEIMISFYRFLNALGIGTLERRSDSLVSDFYNPGQLIIS